MQQHRQMKKVYFIYSNGFKNNKIVKTIMGLGLIFRPQDGL